MSPNEARVRSHVLRTTMALTTLWFQDYLTDIQTRRNPRRHLNRTLTFLVAAHHPTHTSVKLIFKNCGVLCQPWNLTIQPSARRPRKSKKEIISPVSSGSDVLRFRKNRRRLADIARSLIHDGKLRPTITSSACETAKSTASLDHFSLWKWYSLFEMGSPVTQLKE